MVTVSAPPPVAAGGGVFHAHMGGSDCFSGDIEWGVVGLGGPQALWNKEKPRRLGSGQGARESRCESDSELPACLLGKIPRDKTGLRFSAVGGNAEQELSHAQVHPRTGRPPGRLRLIGAWMV